MPWNRKDCLKYSQFCTPITCNFPSFSGIRRYQKQNKRKIKETTHSFPNLKDTKWSKYSKDPIALNPQRPTNLPRTVSLNDHSFGCIFLWLFSVSLAHGPSLCNYRKLAVFLFFPCPRTDSMNQIERSVSGFSIFRGQVFDTFVKHTGLDRKRGLTDHGGASR